MPLYVRHEREGQAISYNWGMWHTEMFVVACAQDQGLDYDTIKSWSEVEVWSKGRHVYQHDYVITDPSDGEVMTIKKGDVVTMWTGR